MSSSSPADVERHHLTIQATDPDLTITVYDGFDNVLRTVVGENMELHLPKGLYTVRTEYAGQLAEQVVRLVDRTVLSPELPRYFSAAPLVDLASSHEYYTGPASQVSQQTTRPPIGRRGQDSWILVFLRAPRWDTQRVRDLADGLALVEADGTVVTAFGEGDAVQDQAAGWLAFSARASSGEYRLRFTGHEPREAPIYLYARWQTQVFLTYHDRPLFEGMRVFMAPADTPGFDPRDDITRAVDMGCTGLQNGVNLLPRHVVGMLLDGKFTNPVLGLLGLHLLLRQVEVNQFLVAQVLANLHGLIPGSPDVQALEVLAARRFGTPLPDIAFYQVPMFRAGLEGVIAASADHPHLIPADSPVDDLATKLYADSVWSSWMPDLPKLQADLVESMPELDWVQIAVLDALEGSQKSRKTLELTDLARNLGLSPRVVMSALARFEQTEPSQITEWGMVADALLSTPARDEPLSKRLGRIIGQPGGLV